MAMDTVKMRSGLSRSLGVLRIADALNKSNMEVIGLLYQSADWFLMHGDYGYMRMKPMVLDLYLQTPGFADLLIELDWLRIVDDRCTLRWFTNISAIRKSIGSKLRSEILSPGCCTYCGSDKDLQIDHIIPVSKGGRTEKENLQPLCRTCNTQKGACL